MSTDCTYCGCDVVAHNPVYVEREARNPEDDRTSTAGSAERSSANSRAAKPRDDGGRRQTGQFCNYGCLSAHIEEAGLATGTTCDLDAA